MDSPTKHICLTFSGGEMTEVVVAVIEDGTQNMETGIGGTGKNPYLQHHSKIRNIKPVYNIN